MLERIYATELAGMTALDPNSRLASATRCQSVV
jgi:hypothetical protein